MKKLLQLLSILLLLTSLNTTAQNGINYKALIKDDSGNVIANTTVQIQFTIVQDVTNVYTETHAPTTDANGIIIVNIGEGTATSGDFNTINWSEKNHSLNVQIDTGAGLVDLGTTQFMSVPYAKHAKTATNASNVNGLETLDEGNGIGWRLIGRNADNHGNIGFNAIDLSFVDDPNLGLGATGSYAFSLGYNGTASGEHALAFGNQNYALNDYAIALGNNNTVSGLNSTAIGGINQVSGDYAFAAGLQNVASENYTVALGTSTTASGEYAIAMGRNTTASGNTSTAMGFETEASASYSTAFGYQTESSGISSTSMGLQSQASGNYSTAIGYATDASGNISTTMGFSTIASAAGSTAIGAYNIGGGTPNLWISTDPLFEIGNGSLNDRNNALTILKNGNVGIGTHTPQDLLHISGGRLRIGNETIEDTGSNQLSVDASLIPNTNDAFRLGNTSNRWIGVWTIDGVFTTSDRRSKTNIVNLNYGLEDVMKLNPVSFNWKKSPNDDTKLGLIAQDLLKVIPEVVKTHDWEIDENGNKTKKASELMSVNYSDLIPVLIKAIQEQQKIIETLNAKNKTQESKLNSTVQYSTVQNYQSLLSRIESLESNTSN